ncbi:MAG: iron export ABC transporter permease subunit FetB [Gammaproteobacteria bacterium]
MPTDFIHLTFSDLLIAGTLMILNGVLSIALRLRLEREMLIATLRMIVQLYLVGLVLIALFHMGSLLWTSLAALAMILFAGHEIMARQDRRLKGFWSYGLGTGCMLFSASLVTIFALSTQLRPDPWFDPQYSIPILGMILGNTMTGISLGLDHLTTSLVRERGSVEAQLALGHTRQEALRPIVHTALRSAMMPILNIMATAGLVALPGMMTGQIVAGIAPMEAVKYQVLIMFLIAGGTAVGSVMAVFGGVYRLTDSRHRLRLDRLHLPKRKRKRMKK